MTTDFSNYYKSIKKKNKYGVLIHPATYGDTEYKVYIKYRKHINAQHPQAGLYEFRVHKKIREYLLWNHLPMKFYDITEFAVSV